MKPDRPKYRVIYESIRSELASGKYDVGNQLPPLEVLMEQYGAALNTVRTAQLMLADEGLVRSEQGRGVYVTALPEVSDIRLADVVGSKLAEAIRLLTEVQGTLASAFVPCPGSCTDPMTDPSYPPHFPMPSATVVMEEDDDGNTTELLWIDGLLHLPVGSVINLDNVFDMPHVPLDPAQFPGGHADAEVISLRLAGTQGTRSVLYLMVKLVSP
ncbi:MAG: winged helix-turn-helix domain-containing protein [Acidimicrobiales bacterium]